MTPRQIRRAAERKADKLARKSINHANAQLSTGPRSLEGKATSSQNSFRHGLGGGTFRVLPTEDGVAFEYLRTSLRAEHDPQSVTQEILVNGLAQHHWLAQRALRLQDQLFAGSDLSDPAIQKQLALYIRYQTTNERAFHKGLADLLKLRKSTASQDNGFVSQNDAAELPYGPGHPEFEAGTKQFLENYNRKLLRQNHARQQVEERIDLKLLVSKPIGFESKKLIADR